MDKSNPPEIPPFFIVSSALNIFISTIESIAFNVLPRVLTVCSFGDSDKTVKYNMPASLLTSFEGTYIVYNNENDIDLTTMLPLAELISSSAVDVLTFFLCGSVDNDLFHVVLKCLQTLCVVTGALDLKTHFSNVLNCISNIISNLVESNTGNQTGKICLLLRILLTVTHTLSHCITEEWLFKIFLCIRSVELQNLKDADMKIAEK